MQPWQPIETHPTNGNKFVIFGHWINRACEGSELYIDQPFIEFDVYFDRTKQCLLWYNEREEDYVPIPVDIENTERNDSKVLIQSWCYSLYPESNPAKLLTQRILELQQLRGEK